MDPGEILRRHGYRFDSRLCRVQSKQLETETSLFFTEETRIETAREQKGQFDTEKDGSEPKQCKERRT